MITPGRWDAANFFFLEADDARLAAAAPDLLAACESGGRYCDALKRHQERGEMGIIDGTDELETLFHDWHDKTHAAIAKATERKS